jgi:hypothetical protein
MKGNFRNAASADILLVDPAGQYFSLVLNKGNGTYYDEIIYGMNDGTRDILCGDLNGDRLTDLLFVSVDRRQDRYSLELTNFADRERRGIAPRCGTPALRCFGDRYEQRRA